MLISAQIRCRTKEVRKYGLLEISPSMSMMSVFDMLRKGLLNTSDNFVLEEQYCCHDVGATVAVGMLEPGQTVPLTSKVEDVVAIQSAIQAAPTVVLPNPDFFTALPKIIFLCKKIFLETRKCS